MTQEDKLLLQDLCARLPYGVNCEGFYSEEPDYKTPYEHIETCKGHVDGIDHIGFDGGEVYIIIEGIPCELFNVKPYLRPMSSMTEEEKKELNDVTVINCNEFEGCSTLFDELGFDWLNAHHFDFRGLIEKGLALKDTDGIYKTKEE